MLRDGPDGDDASAMLDYAFGLLQRAVKDRRSPLHTPTIATMGQNGWPRARTVVLRHVDASGRILRFHSDRRGDKIAELTQNPRISLHGYDLQHKFQIRIEGNATIHRDDEVAELAWHTSQPMSRVCYTVSPPQGRVIASGDAFTLSDDRTDLTPGRDAFCAVLIHFDRLEWLWLAASGHRRARVVWDETSVARSEWLVP
jgi:pyridoxamine 5'-phosphate oxidase